LQAPGVVEEPEGDSIDVLRSLLDAAHGVLRELEGNPLFARLVNLFARMPEGDRAIIIGALERELDTRLLSREVADSLTQIELRPNPNAKVYLRVVGPEDKSEEVEKLAFLRAAYSIQRGIDALDPHWRGMITEALRQMDPAARARIQDFNRAMQEILDEVSASPAPMQQPTPPPAPDVPLVERGPARGKK
jgi:hypothetical protein